MADKKDWTWKIDLMADIFQFTNEDKLDGLDYALSTLTARERNILLQHCRYRKTYKEIGEQYGISGSRVQQIVKKAMRKLRNPARANYILYGFKSYEELKTENKSVTYYQKHPKEEILELNLSTRSYNALRFANILTIEDLVIAYATGAIVKVRSFGERSFLETWNKLLDTIGSINLLKMIGSCKNENTNRFRANWPVNKQTEKLWKKIFLNY